MEDMDFTPGRWAVVAGYGGKLSPDKLRIDAATEKMVKEERYQGRFHQKSKTDVMATFATEVEADDLISKIAGIRGEHNRRVNEASVSARDALAKLLLARGAAQ